MKNIYSTKKLILTTNTIGFIVLSIIEFFKYLSVESNLFGLNYMIINLIIIFLLVPVCINYTKYYSPQRISKLIIIIILMIINSYILNLLVINSMSYIDYSKQFISNIFITKNILKSIILIVLIIFTVFEFKLDKLIVTTKGKKSKKVGK